MLLSRFHLIYGKTLQTPEIEYTSLKIAQGVICQLGFASYLFQRIKLCTFTKFHAFIAISSDLWRNPSKACNRVYQSKKSTRGNLPTGFRILSFSAFQTLYSDQVSCFYLVLQDFLSTSPIASQRRSDRVRVASFLKMVFRFMRPLKNGIYRNRNTESGVLYLGNEIIDEKIMTILTVHEICMQEPVYLE